jgi:hypothetical protein
MLNWGTIGITSIGNHHSGPCWWAGGNGRCGRKMGWVAVIIGSSTVYLYICTCFFSLWSKLWSKDGWMSGVWRICDIDHIHGKWAAVKSIKRIVTKSIHDDDNIYAQVYCKFGDAASKTTMSTDMVNFSLLCLPYQHCLHSMWRGFCKAWQALARQWKGGGGGVMIILWMTPPCSSSTSTSLPIWRVINTAALNHATHGHLKWELICRAPPIHTLFFHVFRPSFLCSYLALCIFYKCNLFSP